MERVGAALAGDLEGGAARNALGRALLRARVPQVRDGACLGRHPPRLARRRLGRLLGEAGRLLPRQPGEG